MKKITASSVPFGGVLLAAALLAAQIHLPSDTKSGSASPPVPITVEGRSDPGQALTLNVRDAAGNLVDDPSAKGSTTAGPDGTFQFVISPPAGATPGDYTAVVTRSDTSSEVHRSPFKIPAAGGESMMVDPVAATVGSRHNLRGAGFGPGLIEYAIYGKSRRQFGVGDVTVGSSGTFDVVFTTEGYEPGSYMVYAKGPSQDAGPVASALLVVRAPQVTLSVRTVGTKGGQGRVVLVSPLDTGGTEGESWEKSFLMGTEIQLLARPADDSRFIGWTVDGASRGRSPTLDITLTAGTTIVATFVREFRAVELASVPTGYAGLFESEGPGLFAIGTDGAAWEWLDLPNRARGWQSLGGMGLQFLTATKNPAGGNALFAIAADGRVMHAWQVAFWPDRWNEWTDVSGPPEMGASLPLPAKSVVATQNPTGGLAIFAIGGDDRIWHAWQDDPGGAWVGWSDVSGPPEMGASLPLPAKSVVATQNPTGGLAIFAIGGDDRIWHAWQDVPKGAWGGWSDVSGPPEMRTPIPVPAHNLVAAQVFDGGLAIFALSPDQRVWFAWQDSPKGAWRGWTTLGGDSTVQLVARSSVVEHDGIHFFTRKTNGQVWTRYQNFPKSRWEDWYQLPWLN